MIITTFGKDGRRLRVERSLSIKCHNCGAELHCPPDEDFWFWLNSSYAAEFYKAHSDHKVGARIKEKELVE